MQSWTNVIHSLRYLAHSFSHLTKGAKSANYGLNLFFSPVACDALLRIRNEAKMWNILCVYVRWRLAYVLSNQIWRSSDCVLPSNRNYNPLPWKTGGEIFFQIINNSAALWQTALKFAMLVQYGSLKAVELGKFTIAQIKDSWRFPN